MNALLEIQKAFELRHKEGLSREIIVNFINELYEPYTLVFNNHQHYKDYRSKLPRYSYEGERNGASETRWNKKGIIYVIPEPKEGEHNKIEAFFIITDKRNKLLQILVLQRKMYSKEITHKGLGEFNKIKNEIDQLFHDVLDFKELSILDKYFTKTGQIGHRKKEGNKNELSLNLNTEIIEHNFYCQVGALFAQGIINEIKDEFYYFGKCFPNPNQLSKYIKEDILTTEKKIRQLISDTINDSSGQKNMYKSKTMMKNTIDYCNYKGLNIIEEFLNKYENLKKN